MFSKKRGNKICRIKKKKRKRTWRLRKVKSPANFLEQVSDRATIQIQAG